VSPGTLTFTSVNWNVAQTVSVTGADDDVMDGNIAYTIVTAAATSLDANYDTMPVADVAVTNTDDDTAGITVTPTSGLITTEAGGVDSFTIVLTSEPTADVTIGLSSSDGTEGTVSPGTLTFTSANWDAPQTVTAAGADDEVMDGSVGYTILTSAAASTDPDYAGMDASDVAVTNIDNDTAGITVTPTTGLITTELGGSATFTVVLDTEPVANVTIGLTSSDVGEGTVSPGTLTFTTANWDAPQTVSVTGADDFMADGDVAYTILTSAATSGDANYAGMDAADVAVTNIDNDTAGITVTPTTGLITTELGGSATFTVVLTSQPVADVTIGLTSSDTGEGTVSPGTLTFTSANWSAARTVSVTGADDAVADGDIAYTIFTAEATSADSSYNNMDAADVSVTNTDNDIAGITVTPTTGLITTEASGTATFTIVLTSEPVAGVTIDLSSSDVSEGTVGPASVTFTSANWSAAQTVTVAGVDDLVQDGDIAYTIQTSQATSGDANYDNVNADDVSVTNTDDDVAGITVTPTTGLETTEASGTATFTIVLTSEPTANVTIDLSSSDTGEGTVGPASVTFTSANWSVAQTLTVTGADDLMMDGDIAYTVQTSAATSGDANYSGMNAADVSVTNTDDDVAGITVTPTTGLTTTEAGGTATFTVVLTSKPATDVAIGLSSSDTGEGTVSPGTITFTSDDWDAAQTVTVNGVDDLVMDGDIAYTILTAAATSGDTNYSAMDAADVSVTNSDDDVAGVTVTPTTGLITTEAGATATFTIVLTTEPAGDVTIGLSSSDENEGTVSPGTVTFTSVNWSAAQTVTVTGVNDFVVDGDAAYTILTAAATSGDANYNGMDAEDVTVTNTDDDTAGVTVTPTTGLITTEASGTATFTIVLTSEPTANVTIDLSSSDTGEGTVGPASVTFTSANWSVAQTLTVTGADDAVDDGNIAYTILTAAATSTDTNYSAMDAADVSVTNTDNDTAGITVTPTTGLTTTERAGRRPLLSS
jgi:hypothetical protein